MQIDHQNLIRKKQRVKTYLQEGSEGNIEKDWADTVISIQDKGLNLQFVNKISTKDFECFSLQFFVFIVCFTQYTLQWELLGDRSEATYKMTGNSFNSMKDFLKQTGGYAVIDGGLATEFERHGADLNDPLWSAKCLVTSPHLIHTVSSKSFSSVVSEI